MAQIIKKLKPITVNTDTAKIGLKETESSFIRGQELAFGRDGKNIQGGNFGVGKKMSSNFQTIPIPLPSSGINKTIGFYESTELNEAYVFNWNSDNQHGIYRLDGSTLSCDTVLVRAELQFSNDPRYAIPDHRCTLRVTYGIDDNGERVVIAKYLIFTNGKRWQNWVDVIAAIATNGFDPTVFPYYQLQQPFFDYNELIDYAVRPPMLAPVVTPITPTVADQSLENLILKQSIQFAYRAIMTDGRPTALSWYSTPFFNVTSDCDANNVSTPRCLNLVLDAGSPLVEQYQIFVRYNGISDTNGIGVNTDFALYDTINKYSSDDENNPDEIENQFWLRINPWADYNYNATDNSITYVFCGDKGTTIFPVEDATLLLQNDIPLKSAALSNTGDVLLWGNNLRFYPNFPQSTMDNISVSAIEVNELPDNCTTKNVKISLYSTFNGAVISWQKNLNDTSRYFCRGKVNLTNQQITYDIAEANKYFLTTNLDDGLLCYLAGTNYYSIGKQYKVDKNGNKIELGVVDNTNAETLASIYSLYLNGGYVMQQYDFFVPAGNYLARLARHNRTVSDNYEQTSTYVMGVAKNDEISQIYTPALATSQDIAIDATTGDVDKWTTTKEIFYLFCPYTPLANNSGTTRYFPFDNHTIATTNWRFIEGYLYDNVDSISGIDSSSLIGVERVIYNPTNADGQTTGTYTDPNGFFFCFNRNNSCEVAFDAKFNCGLYTPQAFRTKINQNNVSGYFPGQIINLGDVNSNLGNFILIEGYIKNCVTGDGISGVGVTLMYGPTFYTDSDGKFSLRHHTLNVSNIKTIIYYNGAGNCLFSNCDCTTLPTVPIDTISIACSKLNRYYPEMPDLLLRVISISGTSLKGGGKYPVSVVGHDFAGRKTAVNLIGYVDIPTFLQKGNFNASKIQVNVNGPLKINPDIKWLTFLFGANTNTSTYIQWVGDKIEFLNNIGEVTDDGNGAIRARITIQSLLDFNIEQNFSTLANYAFVIGDRCRIYDDGQGNLFDPAVNDGYLDYQVLGTNFNQTVDPTTITTTTVTGSTTSVATQNNTYDPKSFIIDYDERLLVLKDKCGFWIELSRPNPQNNNEPFYGISGSYPVINGEITPTSIILDAFDTFYQKRNIIILNCSGADLNHPFESQSITDFWGDNVTSGGAVMFKDPLIQQRWYLNDVIKSDPVVNNGRVNGLGVCKTANRKDFTDQDWGGIISMHSERNILAFICENDWFTSDFQLNYAHVDQYGRVIANPDQSTGIGNPYQKVGDNFGCAYEDISTIQYNDGMAVWLDRKNTAVIIMNFRQAIDISLDDNKGYFIEKLKYLIRYNESIGNDLNNIIETSIGINPNNQQIYVSFKRRNGLNGNILDFINNERETFNNLGETFIYNLNLKKWIGYAPFVPEYYGKMPHSQSGNEFITFANGQAYFHNSKNITGFMNFYGVDTDMVITSCFNYDPSMFKIMQAIAVESPLIKYFISSIKTDDPLLYSCLTLSYFKKRGNVWYSRILRNMSSYPDPNFPVVSMLLDGKTVNGNFVEMQLVADPNNSQEYSELNNILVRFIGSEESGENNQ